MNRDQPCMIPAGHTGTKVALISFFNEKYLPIASLVRENWIAYASRHGYGLRFYPGEYHEDPTRVATYGDKGKFELYYDVAGGCEIVAFLDIDSLFVDMNRKIESLLEPPSLMGHEPWPWTQKRFLWTYADGGPMSGLMIAKTDAITEKHLRYAYEYAAANNNTRHGKIEPNGISDQDAMTRLMHVPPFSETFGNCVEAESVGFCYPDTKREVPWIVTCRGGSVEDKLAALRPWAAPAAPIVLQPPTMLDVARSPEDHPVDAYNPAKEFDRVWLGPVELRPTVFRTQSEKDTWYAVAVENEYGLPFLQPDDVVIDIGAHIGSFSYLAHRNGSRSVYAFEIDPFHYEAAVANLASCGDGVALYHAAVVRGDEKRAAEYRYGGAWNSFGAVGDVVESTSLDQIIEQATEPGGFVRFIKIDCEGGEWPILYTSQKLDRVLQIAGEYHLMKSEGVPELQGLPPISTEALQQFLELKGFDVEIVQRAETNGDFFATRRRQVKTLVPVGGDALKPEQIFFGKVE